MTAMRAGLCSVTFRQLPAEAIVDLAAEGGVEAIEWGADVHVPPGDTATAEKAAARCADAGVACASYGSYLAVGRDPAETGPVIETAAVLGADNVRVWCPDEGGTVADVARALDTIAMAAAEHDLTVSLEFHPGTLTETAASTLALLAEVEAPNVFTYWQPDPRLEPFQFLAELARVLEHLSHVHVFHWRADHRRLPLAGAEWWSGALRIVRGTAGRWTGPRVAFIEFVPDDDPEQLAGEVATLRTWLSELDK